MSSLVFRITGDPTSAKSAIASVSSSLDGMGRKAQSVSQQMASLGSSLTIGLTLPVVAAGTAFVKAAADMEKLNKGLASIMGSATAGAAEMKKLQDAAKLPGLGLEGAVQGSIRLQVLGKTADESRKIMAELGNAIALVGGGKDDFAEVTRQLGQMLSVGKVTKENLDTITERIPQISKIMIDTWGPQSVGDPAKFFEKAGISSKQFVDIIVSKLGEGARAGDTFANKLGNLEEAIKLVSARIGEKLLPAIEKLLPKLEGLATGAANAVDAFTQLPLQLQNTGLALGSLLLAAGPVLAITSKLIDGFDKVKKAVGLAGIAMGALFGATVVAMIAQTMTAIDQLNQRYADLKKARDLVSSGKADPISGLTQSGDDLGKFKIDLKAVGDELDLFGKKTATVTPPVKDVDAAVGELTKKMPALAKVTFESALLIERMAQAHAEDEKHKKRGAEIAKIYGVVSSEAAIKAAREWDKYFKITRELSDPTLFPATTGIGVAFKDIPKFDGTISGGDFEEFERMGENIGELGMQTKEQYDAMKRAAQDSAKGQTAALRQVSTVITDLSRGLARNIIDWKGWRETGVGAVKNLAEAVTRSLIEGVLAKLSTKLIEVSGLMSAIFKGATGVASSAAPAIGAAAGLAVPTIGAAVGLGGQIGAGAAVPAAGGISGAVGGLTSIIGAVASVGSLISGIVGNFQSMAMNKSLDLIEHEVRYSQIHLLHTLNRANEFWPYMKLSWESLLRMEGKGAGGGGTVINNNINGGFFVGNNAIDELLDMLTRRMKQQGV